MFSIAFQLFLSDIFKHETHHFVIAIILVQFLVCCLQFICLHIPKLLSTFRVFCISKKMYRKCDFMFFVLFTWWFWYLVEKFMQFFHAIIFLKSRTIPLTFRWRKSWFNVWAAFLKFLLFLTPSYFHQLQPMFFNSVCCNFL